MKYHRGIRRFIIPSILLHLCVISLLIFLLRSTEKQNELTPYEVTVLELRNNGIGKNNKKYVKNKQTRDINIEKPVKATKKDTSKKIINEREVREKSTDTIVKNTPEVLMTNPEELTVGTNTGNASETYNSSANRTRQAYPDYNSNPKPDYPLMARRRGYEGTVLLRVKVLTNGKVGKLDIEQSSNYEILDKTALDAVSHWTFIPATRNGIAVNSWVTVPIKFALKDS